MGLPSIEMDNGEQEPGFSPSLCLSDCAGSQQICLTLGSRWQMLDPAVKAALGNSIIVTSAESGEGQSTVTVTHSALNGCR